MEMKNCAYYSHKVPRGRERLGGGMKTTCGPAPPYLFPLNPQADGLTEEQKAEIKARYGERLAHHGYILLFEGESYRMKHALMRQKS